MALSAPSSSSRRAQGVIGLCFGLALLMVLASMARQGWLPLQMPDTAGGPAGSIDLKPMTAELQNDAFIRSDHTYFSDDPIVSITDRVGSGVRDALSKTGKRDRFATRLHASWDHAIKEIARTADSPDDLRFALRPYFTAWMDDYIWLLRHAEMLGFTFESLDDSAALSRSRAEQLLFLRYDIHVRDIAPFYGILDANRSLDLPSVAYLQWGYSDLEAKAAADFIALRKFQSPRTRFGLHLSPIPTLLSREKGGYKPYVAWLKTQGLASLGDEFGGVERWTTSAVPRQVRPIADEIIKDFESGFGAFRSISLHGSEFDNAVRRHCAGRTGPCDLDALVAGELFSSPAFDDLAPLIIDRTVDDHGLSVATDSTPAQTVVCRLQQAADKKKSLVLLLHPAQFMRGRRLYRELPVGDDGLIDCAEPS